MSRNPGSKQREYAVTHRGSAAVEALEAAWELLRGLEPKIPPAVVTFVDLRSRRGMRGYFASSVWKKRRGAAHEVAISPQLIGHEAQLIATMLHEAAHAILYECGQDGGMGSTRYYHTIKFRDQCLQLGLACEFLNTRYGWTITHWPGSGIPVRYSPVLRLLRQQLPAGTGARAPSKRRRRELPRGGHTRLVCACVGGTRAIYVKKTLLKDGGVICRFCGQEFVVPS